jgi:hypothetical protein
VPPLQLRAIIDASDVPTRDQPLLLLLGELMFVSPQYGEDGKLIDYESVVRQTERDIVEHQMGPGVRGKYLRLTTLNVKVREWSVQMAGALPGASPSLTD